MFNPRTHEDYDAIKGREVFTADNDKIGTVNEVLHPANDSTAPEMHYFVVKPGMLDQLTGQDEVYIPATAVSMVSEDRVVLETPTASIRNADWSKPRNAKNFRRK